MPGKVFSACADMRSTKQQIPQFCEPVSVTNSWQNFPASPSEKLMETFTDFDTDIFKKGGSI